MARLRRGVATDRRISIEDASMRHGRKSKATRVDGYKRHVVQDLDLDVIATDRGTIGFNAREGIDATSLTTLDNFEYGWAHLTPRPFSSTSTEIVYDMTFAEPIRFLEVRDIHGHGLRFGE